MLDTKTSTQKQIEDLEHERNGLVFRRTTKAAVDAAKLLSGAATKAREQECGKVGDNCRTRQDAQATALAALTKAQENKATTDRFDEIETELKRLRSNRASCLAGVARKSWSTVARTHPHAIDQAQRRHPNPSINSTSAR